ncbi:MAG: asparaginase, partial [Mogibacterium sp.]|nr:asparaginase [Mogibacterium sp.]
MDRRVLIINTGGTIGMVRTENGYAPKKGALTAELEQIRDLRSPDIPSWDILEFDPLLDSTNVKYEQWNQIAHAIEDNYSAYDGFVVLHGTDTLAYSASALSFMFEGLNKPVVFTGSQIPLCELRSDGRDNLITSIIIAADGIANGVGLYFGNYLYRGNRTTKYSADGMEAFASPNYPALAKAGIDIEYMPADILRTDTPGADSLVLTE